MRQRCTLILSNGERFQGDLIGAPLESSGEMVFTTGMVGYSEAMTDPSYFGEILVFAYPLIGNYGVPPLPKEMTYPLPSGWESNKVHASAVIVSIDSREAFHWNSFEPLSKWLEAQGVPGIVGIDTRHLVHTIRKSRNLLGRISPERPEGYRNLGSINPLTVGQYFDPSLQNVLPEVSRKDIIKLGKGKIRIGLVDCGVKWNIISQLLKYDCEVQVLPWDTDFSKIDCHGWLLSNGPGDPIMTGDLKDRVKSLLQEDRPILGICLGHQLLSLAAGATTHRMPYGHRSHNQPVYVVHTRNGYMTSQNHGFVVDDKSLPSDWEPWFRNANDQTIEGIKHKTKHFRSVQFHPESAGGPRDTGWIIEEFISEVKKSCL